MKTDKPLKELRVSADLTQIEIFKRTGINQGNISSIESGRITPTIDTIAKYAKACGYSIEVNVDEQYQASVTFKQDYPSKNKTYLPQCS